MRTKLKKTNDVLCNKFLTIFVISLLYGSLYSLPICAAETAQDTEPDYVAWIKDFVNLRTNNKDSALPLMKIKEYYSSLSDNDKKKVNDRMIEIISGYVGNNLKEETMAMIDLYDFLVEKNDAKRPDLYFIKGNIYAERQDSVMLKETIAQLENSNGKPEYIEKLNDYLLQIRRFVAADKDLDGYWVSDVLMTDIWGNGLDIPKYMINVVSKNDITEMLIDTQCPFITKICITTKGALALPVSQVSQYLFPISMDSLYVAWSSEKLKNYDADLVGMLRQATGTTSATLSGMFAQRNKYSTSETMLGNMTTGLVEVGLNSVFDAIFTPSKKLYLLEGKLKRINDHILRGKFTYTQSKIKAGNESNARFDTNTEDVSLFKWTPESGVVFMGWNSRPITPYPLSFISVEKQKKKIEKRKKKLEKAKYKKSKVSAKVSIGALLGSNVISDTDGTDEYTILPYWKDLMKDVSTEYGKACLDYKNSKNKKEFIKEWNKKQIEKLLEYNMANGK